MASLSFWGGVGTVTGSKYLIESERGRVLVDCGLFQGLKELRDLNWQEPPFDASSIDACIITHAHIDHTGYLPRLVRLGFDNPVYCSKGTADLLKLLLPDSGRLQEEEADYRNRHKLTRHAPALPLYTEEDARAAIKLIRPVANSGEPVEITKGLRAGFRIAGHIFGSSLVLVEVDGAGVRHGERPGVAEAHRARAGVRLLAEGERAGAEHLRPRGELDVDLEPDDGLEALSHGQERSRSRSLPRARTRRRAARSR